MTGWLIETDRTISQADIDWFAKISGDTNSFHVDQALAALGPFEKTVVHGVLLTAIVHGLIGEAFSGIRVRRESARFHAPTFPGDAMLFRITEAEQTEGRTAVQFEVARKEDGTVTCSGTCEFSQ